MDITRVTAAWFSPTGGTAGVVRAVAARAARALDVPLDTFDFTLPRDRRPRTFPADHLVVVGTPVYAGKVPNKLLPWLKEGLLAAGAPAAAVVTFGNRSFDNALAELCAVLEGNGFHTLAAGAFALPHAFSARLGAGRPDGADRALMDSLALTAVRRAGADPCPPPVAVPGDPAAPYYTPLGTDGQPAAFLRAKPGAAPACDGCGLCARVCPMGAISPEDPREVPGTCIKCQACVSRCPKGARYFDDPAFLSHVAMLEQTFTRQADSRIFP